MSSNIKFSLVSISHIKLPFERMLLFKINYLFLCKYSRYVSVKLIFNIFRKIVGLLLYGVIPGKLRGDFEKFQNLFKLRNAARKFLLW